MKCSFYSLLTVLFLMVVTCTKGQAQTINGSFTHGGVLRTYHIYLPANYATAGLCPVVFNLHGYGSNGTQQASLSQFNAIADTAGCVVVYPEGLVDGTGRQRWNSGYGFGTDDVGFINRLLDTVLLNYRTDANKVYSTGISNGAIMSHTLACELGQRFAAIGSVSGTMSRRQLTSCVSASAIPVIHVHGTTDIVVPYNGNTSLISVADLISHWRGRNNLSTNSTTVGIPNTNTSDNSTADYIRYEDGSCDWVHLLRINNGGHSWPGSGVLISGNTNMDVDASLEIWRFFRGRCVLDVSKPVVSTLTTYVAEGRLYWEGEDSDRYALTIYNAWGQAVAQAAPGRDQYGLMDLPKGWYVAQWQYGVNQYVLRFILM